MLVNMSAGSLEDFYPAIAIAILMRYIRDPSLSQHHRTVVQAITFIFKSLGSKCIPYLSQVVPAYLHVIRASEAIFREVHCLLLNVKLIYCILHNSLHTRKYMPLFEIRFCFKICSLTVIFCLHNNCNRLYHTYLCIELLYG